MTGPVGQQNPYKGTGPRAWIRVTFPAPNGSSVDAELIADTGCPHAIVVGLSLFNRLQLIPEQDVASNFGALRAGWIRLSVPAAGIDTLVVGYGSDAVLAIAKQDHADFEGLVGLPVLRMAEYGGDANSFWFRPATPTPTPTSPP